MWAHQAVADACCMDTKNYAIALPAAAGLAAVLLLTACGGGISTSSHPSAGTTTSPAAARAASTVTVTDQDDSNWAGYVVGNSATAKTSFSAVSGSWTQPAADCAAGSPVALSLLGRLGRLHRRPP
jgi:hypothetical protein